MTSRNRKSLSLKEKRCILKKVDENQHLKRVDLAKELGLPVSTLNTLIYKRKIIGESHHQSGSSASKRLRVQSGKLADVEKVLLRWFNQCRSVKIPISGLLLMKKTIKNCVALGRFLTPVDVNPIGNAESDHFVPPENRSNLSDATAFEEFVQSDSELATCSLLTIDEMIANEETSSEEEDNCTEKPLPSFQQALAGFNTMQE
ncbi:hypothetical protein AVEN_9747-1 [Araneus ventricosus]|uniref:HTH psq-type domain-containing protein n=1 Tax=Araneus ventricosus TaxID=182803 RepID=A0A4Y2PU88_ARAVE|nr:hypothetical protein AVEN_9747-1 [Araneus ventricosus]